MAHLRSFKLCMYFLWLVCQAWRFGRTGTSCRGFAGDFPPAEDRHPSRGVVKGDHVQLGTSSMHPTWGLGHSLGASRSTYTEPSFCDIFQYLSVDINTLRVFQLERKTVSRTINELGALFPVKNILQINIYIYIYVKCGMMRILYLL